jgi:predicted site-specific integrase-resolvase
MIPEKKLLPTRATAARYGVCTKTVERWRKQGVLPEPTRINGRNYDDQQALEKLERASMGSRLSAAPNTETIEPLAPPDG